jgi:periplasmic protein TonB
MLASRKNRISIIASLTVHAGFLLGFLLLSVRPPLTVQTFNIRFEQLQENQPVASAPQPAQAVPTRREIERPKTQNQPPQPTQRKTDVFAHEQPDAPPDPAQEPHLPPVKTNVGSAASAAPVAQAGEKRTNPGVVDTAFGEGGAPRFLHRELPVYPHRARYLEREGKVVLKLFIDHMGRLLNVTVVEAAAYGFTEAALDAVKKSTFAPARRNGQSVASRAVIAIRFRLESE